MTKSWQLAWGLNNTCGKQKVFYRAIFWMPQQRQIREFFQPVDIIMDDATDTLQWEKPLQSKNLMISPSTPSIPPPSQDGILPRGLDCFVVLARYKALHHRAKELSTRHMPAIGQGGGSSSRRCTT